MTAATLTTRSWEFDPPEDADLIEQVRWGKTTTIDPRRLVVSRHVKWGLHVLVEGRRIKRDGTQALIRASASWDESDLMQAPEWVRTAVTELAS